MDDDTGSRVVRAEFSTTDPDVANEVMHDYATHSTLTITGVAEDFEFAHSALIAPRFSVNRMQMPVDLIDDAVTGPDDPFTVIQQIGGRVAYVRNGFRDTYSTEGDVVLLPPVGPLCSITERADIAVVRLDRFAVAAYAAATTGLDVDGLAFHDLTALTPDHGRHWVDTAAHVRDSVLTEPWAARSPIMLDQAFRLLAAVLLSAFPNTALDRATAPESPPVRGEVSEATLREVIDFLESGADQPVGPVDVAELAGMPSNEIVEGLRRRRGIHPAQLLWQARLRGVRRDLVDADPTSTRVAPVAARWGFAHPGRFRVAYLRRFDETPEQTLRR